MNAKAPERVKLYEPDDFFLSGYNPIMTVDQRDAEARALRLYQHPDIQAAKKMVEHRWRQLAGFDITAEAEKKLPELVEEFTYGYVFVTINGDPNYPKFINSVYAPPHEWMGMKVMGTRMSGGDGTDHNYAFVPVDYGGRFEITGQRFEPVCSDTPYMLMGNFSFNMNQDILQSYDLVVDADGKFTITLDPDPANGRPNHIQTLPSSRMIFIRECKNDWRQVPAKHRVRRLTPPTMPPLTDEQIVRQAIHEMSDAIPRMFYYMRVFRFMEPNTITQPFHSAEISAMTSQQISFCRPLIKDDEALVITIGHGDAAFRDIVLQDYWFRTLSYWKKTCSFNPSQSAPNTDGKSTTYVVSIQDPGVHNWLDTEGFHETLLVNRWQKLTTNLPPEDRAFAEAKLVKLKVLDSVLPAGMKRITPQERAAQLAERVETFNQRYAE